MLYFTDQLKFLKGAAMRAKQLTQLGISVLLLAMSGIALAGGGHHQPPPPQRGGDNTNINLNGAVSVSGAHASSSANNTNVNDVSVSGTMYNRNSVHLDGSNTNTINNTVGDVGSNSSVTTGDVGSNSSVATGDIGSNSSVTTGDVGSNSSVTTGDIGSNSSSSVGDITNDNDSSASIGDQDLSTNSNASASTGDQNNTITIEDRRQVPAPAIINPSISTPQLSGGVPKGTGPINAKNLNLVLKYLESCPPTYRKGSGMKEVRDDGESSVTQIVFTPHANARTYAKKLDNEKPKETSLIKIPSTVLEGEHRYLCLGIMQVQAKTKEAGNVPIQTVIYDAVHFSNYNIKGFSKVYLILVPSDIGVNMGVSSTGGGFGVTPGASGFVNSTLATLGIGYTNSNGNTFPVAQLGTTFIAVAASGEYPADAPMIDFGTLIQ